MNADKGLCAGGMESPSPSGCRGPKWMSWSAPQAYGGYDVPFTCGPFRHIRNMQPSYPWRGSHCPDMSQAQTWRGGPGVTLHTWQVGELLAASCKVSSILFGLCQKEDINRGSPHITCSSDTQLSANFHGEECVQPPPSLSPRSSLEAAGENQPSHCTRKPGLGKGKGRPQ